MSRSPFRGLDLQTLRAEVETTPRGAILWITLNRPRAFNAVSAEMLAELHTVLDALYHPSSMLTPLPADHPRVVVLSAAGPAFSGGVDIKAMTRGLGGAPWDYKDMRSQQLLARAIEKLRTIPQPVIAAVQGPAAGAGLALAIAADVRVATPKASFSAAFVRLGLTGSDMGTSYFLPRLAGLGIASEALLTGRAISAERAHTVGLVNELAADEAGLEAAARRFAADMLACSPLGLQLTKEQLNAAGEGGGSLKATMTAENSHQMLLVNDPETGKVAQAWVDALLAKRPRAKL
jgi:enoyl-CoA hydratase/carnithine racemase